MSKRANRLPPEARRRLTADLRSRSLTFSEITNSSRSVPLVHESWSARLAVLPEMLQRVEEAAAPAAYSSWTYTALSASLARLNAARLDIVALLIALAPFDSRNLPAELGDAESDIKEQPGPESADGRQTVELAPSGEASARVTTADILRSELLTAVDYVVDNVLDAIEAGNKPPRVTVDLAALAPSVPTIAVPDRGTALAVAFGMDTVPIDGHGSFSPSRVFEAHKYANSPLIARLLTHMRAFGLEPPDDPLSMILTIGWIVQAPDAVLAWQTLRSTVLRLTNAEAAAWVAEGEGDLANKEGPDAARDGANRPVQGDASDDSELDVLSAVLAHLADREEALRQSRRRIESSARMLKSADTEEAAHALADVYRRLVEGPVRHYGWAMRRLAAGSWTSPPMVGSLADGFAADPWLNAALVPKLLPDVRNSQAHEALEWDGRRGVFVVEGVDVDFERVNIAAGDCMSFALGCEAAIVYWRALAAEPGAMFPTAGQPGRTANWRRVEALFGTNGLLIQTFRFNTLRLEARVQRLDREDINPSLQALVHARKLLPHVETFAFFTPEAAEPVIEVDARALDANHPVWVHARQHFDSMPLSTFLPANLNARLRHEAEDAAAHAVAWIASDCALDALDGLPPIWQAEHLWLVSTRVQHARLALRHTMPMLQERRPLELVLRSLDDVQVELGRLLPFTRAAQVDRRPPIVRLRALWAAWGPVPRMPGVESAREDPSPAYQQHSQRRTTSAHDRWTNI